MNKSIIIAAASMTIALVTPAFASNNNAYCGDISGQWMSKAAAKTKATQMGYDVRRIKRENGCYEVYAIGKNGTRMEIYMNPVTGAVVKTKNKS
jgi:hypothetical protein